MALIKCKECGKEISDQATSCPNCGAKTETGKLNANASLLCTMDILFTIVGGIGLFNNYFMVFNIICLILTIIGLSKSRKDKIALICFVLLTMINLFLLTMHILAIIANIQYINNK